MSLDLQLSADEARVLGVLIEKSMTTPEQYPLSLNALMNGCNQKSNRSPVCFLEPDEIKAAMQGLREKQLAVEIWPSGGSRIAKFRHIAETGLGIQDKQAAILAELLLRRAQMPGELRTRASRMAPIESQSELKQLLQELIAKGLVTQLPPAAGSRAESYDHCLCADVAAAPTAPAIAAPAPATPSTPAPPTSTPSASQLDAILERLDALEARIADLEDRLN
jgi:uncharacterized protein YceH (UPF0502 family)